LEYKLLGVGIPSIYSGVPPHAKESVKNGTGIDTIGIDKYDMELIGINKMESTPCLV